MKNIPVVPFFISHRGCPHQCVFCDQRKISGSDGKLPTAAEITGRIAEYRLSAKGAAVDVAFYGGTFTALPPDEQERLLQPVQSLIAAGDVRSVRVSTRPDSIGVETAQFLRRKGVTSVELGVQSMDDDVLQQSGRGHTAADTEIAVHRLLQQGLHVGAQLMPGLPGDSTEKALESLKRIVALQVHFLRIYPALVINGTSLADLYRRGSYCPMSLPAALQLCKVMLHETLKKRLPVIRMGLQPTSQLEEPGIVLAGPYHPAFRHLVEAELAFDLMCVLINGLPDGATVEIRCAPEKVSTVVGQRRANIQRLEGEHGILVSRVVGQEAMSPTEIAIAFGNRVKLGDMVSDLSFDVPGTSVAQCCSAVSNP